MKYLPLLFILFFTVGCEFDPFNFKKVKSYAVENNVTLNDNNETKKSFENNSTLNENNNSATKNKNTLKKDNTQNGKNYVTSVENNNTKIVKKDKILILDNDVYDPDYIPLVLGAMHENKKGYTRVGLIIISDIGVSNKTNMLYRSILETFNSDIELAITHKHEGVVFKSKLTNNLENYVDIISDEDTQDAIEALENKLQEQEDATVTYATGGKLKFLKDFISDPYRLELFKLKVKDIIFGLGCNPRDMYCQRDHNLASTKEALNATKIVYSKLHGKIPFTVVSSNANNVRSLDVFKNAQIPLMNHLLGTNIYGTYGDHRAGDIEILLANSRKTHFNKYKCNVAFTKESFKAMHLGNGTDNLLVNKDIDIHALTRDIYKILIGEINN